MPRSTKDEMLDALGQAVHDCFAAECTDQEVADVIAEEISVAKATTDRETVNA